MAVPATPRSVLAIEVKDAGFAASEHSGMSG